nr:hypothetical protein [Tanacetum cinerariifolium]
MSTQQDICATGSENHPPMLNKENYVPWSSRLLRYAKSRPNGKLIHNSIINVPYVRRMIPEPGDPNHEVPINETFRVQKDDELTEKELKQIEADDQAIQTILLGLPEDIYATVDSCETAKEIWLPVQQMMKGSNVGIQEKKAKLFNEWERFTSTDGESIESYYHHFLKLMNDLKRNKHFPEKIVSNLKFLNNLQPEWSRHVTIVHQTKDLHTADYTQFASPRSTIIQSDYMQQPMPNPEDITNPTTVMNMALALMAKAFKQNYSPPTNNNHRISSNPRNRQIAQPGMNMGQDRQMQMVEDNSGNQFRQYAGQNVRNLNGYNDVQNNPNGNGNLVAARSEGNATGHSGNQIRCYNYRGLVHFTRNCTVRPRRRDAAYLQTQLLIAQKEEARIQLQAKEFDFMAAVANLDEIKEVYANCILMANLQGTVEQHPVNVEETRVLYDSLYNNLAIEVEKVNTVNRKLSKTKFELTTELARYKNQESSGKQIMTLNEEISDLNKQLSVEKSTVSSLLEEKKRLESEFKICEDELLDKQIQLEKKIKELDNILVKMAKFVGDFKSLAKEADESFAKHKALELEIKRLLRAVVSHDIMSVVKTNSVDETSNLQTELERTKERFENCIIKNDNEYAKLWNDWYKKCEECKFDKISYDKAYNDMQQKIEHLQAQLGDLKDKSKDTLCVADTLNLLSQKLENENVELKFQVLNYAKENAHLKTTYKNLFDSISVTQTQTKTIIDSLQNKLQDTMYESA